MRELPKIISVDDHVVEPPDLWTERIPAKYKDRAPRVERDSAVFHFEGGVFSYEKGVEGETVRAPLPRSTVVQPVSTRWSPCSLSRRA